MPVETLMWRNMISDTSPSGVDVLPYLIEHRNRSLGEELMKYLDEHGPCVAGPIAGDIRHDDVMLSNVYSYKMRVLPVVDATDADWREFIRLTTPQPVSPDADGGYLFEGGVADGQRYRTHGALVWYVPGPTSRVSLADWADDITSAAPEMVHSTYFRGNDRVYRLQGGDR